MKSILNSDLSAQLSLDVDVDNFKYNGTVDITIEPQKVVDQVTLHSNGLNIGNTYISYWEYGYFLRKWGDVLSVTEDKNLTTITLNLSKPLIPGRSFELRIEFDGEIRKELRGFYRSSYKIGNETRWATCELFKGSSFPN